MGGVQSTELAAEVSVPPKTKPNVTGNGVLASAMLRSIQHGVERPMGLSRARRVRWAIDR
ncbi:hypothetical protein PAHAL_5G199700 [Panicum hallii]|uniref:Uncharacterized protein n=1 Tax=Panicum hallii TaxID=206008 RepID=A0A2T8IKR7_9POAL|nr:hypothetical protein PAHAL_5G199700 [Panicum hallii]